MKKPPRMNRNIANIIEQKNGWIWAEQGRKFKTVASAQRAVQKWSHDITIATDRPSILLIYYTTRTHAGRTCCQAVATAAK